MKRLAPFMALFLGTAPVHAHQGPPFPILVDRQVGPFIASVWTDPDVGTGTFFIVLEPPEGQFLPEKTRVRIGLQPVSRRLPEAVYEAELRRLRRHARYYAEAPLDKAEMWRVRILLDSEKGGGELAAQVEATPDGTLGPWASLIYLLPFLGIGLLWLKAAMRRRAPAPSAPAP